MREDKVEVEVEVETGKRPGSFSTLTLASTLALCG